MAPAFPTDTQWDNPDPSHSGELSGMTIHLAGSKNNYMAFAPNGGLIQLVGNCECSIVRDLLNRGAQKVLVQRWVDSTTVELES